MNKVLELEYDAECFVLVSFSRRTDEPEYRVQTHLSFLFRHGDTAVEWEPMYGPIQIWHKANEGDDGAKPHYSFPFIQDTPMNWSQMAVDKYELPRASAKGDWRYIFSVLRSWHPEFRDE